MNTEKILWALRDDVKVALDDLVAIGLDRDLALGILEQVLPETELFELSDE